MKSRQNRTGEWEPESGSWSPHLFIQIRVQLVRRLMPLSASGSTPSSSPFPLQCSSSSFWHSGRHSCWLFARIISLSFVIIMNPLPRYAYLSPQAKDREAELTRQGVYNLIPSEVFWQSRQQFLEKKGYILRHRYRPGWEPSWLGTDRDPTYCEDSILLSVSRSLSTHISSF